MDRRRFLAGAAAVTATAGLGAVAPQKKLRVAIIGCGRMGQFFAEVYRRLPDTELAAIAEWNDERRPAVGKRFGVDALFKDVNAMLKEFVPDIAAVITPTKFMKEAVIKCAEAGVRGVSTDKPIAAHLSDADEMVDACRTNGVIFAGGNLQRAKWEVQQTAKRLQSGEFGRITGAAIHGFGGEISGGGCQHLSVLRLLTDAEVDEVIAWGDPPEALRKKDDQGLNINGHMRLSSGIDCQVFGLSPPDADGRRRSGVDVLTEEALVRWWWGVPQIFKGRDAKGARKEIDPKFPAFPGAHVYSAPPLHESYAYLVSSIQSFIRAVNAEDASKLFISGHDLRQALEIAIACKQSALLGNVPVKLPLKDRSLTLFPQPYRWLGGDVTGRVQSVEDAAGIKQAP